MSSCSRQVFRPASAEDLIARLNSFMQLDDLSAVSGQLDDVVEGLEAWGETLTGSLGNDVGLPFLKTWWRKSQLKGVLRREFGIDGHLGPLDYHERLEGHLWAPLGTILHWPAANVPIQPFLSLTSGLLAGSRNIVRVPTDLLGFVDDVLALAPPRIQPVLDRVLFVAFPHEKREFAEECAKRADAAMVWGGSEAVASVRSLPFPHWARIEVFGPRNSAVMILLDEATLRIPSELQRLCRRVAREVWQFDQRACSSPLALYLQLADDVVARNADDGGIPAIQRIFVDALEAAFSEEEGAHPRWVLAARESVDIAVARASWLLNEPSAKAVLSSGPAWSILYGGDQDRIPELSNGKILHIVWSSSLEAFAERLNGNTQTIGTWIHDLALESRVARRVVARGIDRVVRLGLMHVFNTPWDGRELVRPLCRKAHFVPSRPIERPADA
jgi:hypothetical protein